MAPEHNNTDIHGTFGCSPTVWIGWEQVMTNVELLKWNNSCLSPDHLTSHDITHTNRYMHVHTPCSSRSSHPKGPKANEWLWVFENNYSSASVLLNWSPEISVEWSVSDVRLQKSRKRIPLFFPGLTRWEQRSLHKKLPPKKVENPSIVRLER